MPFTVLRGHSTLALVLLLGCAELPPSEAIAPIGRGSHGHSALPVVKVVRAGPYAGIGSDAYARRHYTDVRATIQGSFTRPWDGSTGSYKVPLRLIYPDFCASAAVVETLHPNYVGEPVDVWRDFHIPCQNDPDFDPLFDLACNEAFTNIGARGLFGRPPNRAHVYAGVIAEPFAGILEYIAAQPANVSLGLHLDRPTDLGFVYAGVSRWLREHKKGALGGLRGPCVVDQVVVFGYSYTASLARSFLFSGLNTELRDRGPVFDGALLAGDSGPSCVDLRSHPLAEFPCGGATPSDQGPVISVRSDTDFELFGGDTLYGGPDDDHYVVHHIAGGAHVNEQELSLAAFADYFELEFPNRQNSLDRGPVIRADLRNLLRWAGRGVPPPPTTLSPGEYVLPDLGVGVLELDRVTGNTKGGVQLPALAAPLGLYRGTECHGARDLDGADSYLWMGSGDLESGKGNYILEPSNGIYGLYCLDKGTDHFDGGSITGYELISGVFLPYTSIPGDQHCAKLYPRRGAFTLRVLLSAFELARDGFILEDEVVEVIAAALAATREHPGCVPPR